MPSSVVTGNATAESLGYRGWFLGHFVTPQSDPRFSESVEVKWTHHPAGDRRARWSYNQTATSLSILIRGRFRIQFRDGDVVLSQEGDYALWQPGVAHCWIAEADSIILTVRFPSIAGDSVEVS